MPVALVTGANRGIGSEVARQLLARGFEVWVTARGEDAAASAAEALGGAGARPLRLDVAEGGSVAAAAAAVGELDVLVCNAAIHYDPGIRASEADLDVVREALETNLLGAWRCALAFLPALRRSTHGRIVMVSSEAGSISGMTSGGSPAYRTSKAALNALSRTLAAELRSDGILVNAICPGWTATDMGGPGGRPVAQGAASVVWAATLPDDGPTGGFFRDGRPLPW